MAANVLLAAASICVLALQCYALSLFEADLNEHWDSYKKYYGRKYSGIEEGGRRLIWERNVRKINKHNLEADLGKHTYWMGVNRFTDRTPKELDQMRSCIVSSNATIPKHSGRTNRSLPDSVDWRDQGYVTDVKDQGQCGSCWAFSTTGTLEGQVKATTGKLVSLSEQNLVDCAWSYGNYGCNGGWMYLALAYVQMNGGIDTEESYPYEGSDNNCRFNPSTIGAKISGYNAWLYGDETDLQEAVATIGPISIAIHVSDNFFSYKGGVFYDPNCYGALNHGVLAVGYGTQGSDDYWIVKNSWSESWGTNGYILMARNKNNNCGVSSFPAYPIM